MSEFDFYVDVLQALERIGAQYMVVGEYGASAYGLNRTTYDVDIIVDLNPVLCAALASHFPPPRYNATPEHLCNAIQLGNKFNLTDGSSGASTNLSPLPQESWYGVAFENRVRRAVVYPQDNQVEFWCARPEDIIVGKLMAWQEGR